MKIAILLLISIIALSFPLKQSVQNSEKYCANLKDGVMVLTKDGIVVTSEVTINDSTTITPDCVIIKKDGTKTSLKDGECIASVTNKDKTEKRNK
jgi:preprotein translocase subunit YajC